MNIYIIYIYIKSIFNKIYVILYIICNNRYILVIFYYIYSYVKIFLKPMGPDGMCPQVLRDLSDVIARSLPIIFDQSRQLGEVTKDWRKANATPTFTKKEDPGNLPITSSLTTIPGKVIDGLIFGNLSQKRTRKSHRVVSMASPKGSPT